MLGEKPTPLTDDEIDGMKAVAQWHKEIKLYEKETSVWHQRAKDAQKRYKDERNARDTGAAKYNILWSTIQTLLPALYARNPKPDVSRRFLDADPIGRVSGYV